MIRSADTPIPLTDVRAQRQNAPRSRGGDFARTLTDVRSSSPRAGSLPSSSDQAEPASTEPPFFANSGFVRSDASAPGQVPRFDSVPESAQWPLGPYKQAPAEFGGEWWQVNPFNGPEPWVRAGEIASGSGKVETVQPSDDFLKLFGPRPQWSDSATHGEHQIKSFIWERELETFEGVGVPDGYSEEQVQTATDAMKQWGMGDPVFYKGRNGWAARFPDSLTPDFQISPETAIKAPQVTVAVYQVRAILRGVDIPNRHPLVPSGVFPPDSSTANA